MNSNSGHSTTSTRAGTAAQPAIARATYDDCDDLVRMFEHLHDFNASLNEQFKLADNWEPVLRHSLEMMHGEDRTAIWIARVDGRSAGFLMIEQHLDSPIFARQRWAEITAIYVGPDFRGTSVSHNLIGHAYEWAAERGLDDIRLYVTANNDRARAFYEAEGFTHIQEIWSRPIVPNDERSP